MTDHDEIEAKAAAWVARRDGAGLDPQEEADFNRWLQSSVAHRVSYLRMQATWERTRRMRALEHRAMPASTDTTAPRGTAWYWAAAACFVLVCVGSWMGWQYGQSIYRTEIGAMQTVALLDGSSMSMNTDSEARVIWSAGQRRVDVRRGEAFFQVTRDAERPFVVQAGNAEIQVVGTEFAVHRAADGVEVLVSEGSVQVRLAHRSPDATKLTAGDAARLSPAGIEVRRLSADDLHDALAWRRGMLVFRDTPLMEAVAEFNRYRELPIVIADPELAQMRIGGTFRTTNAGGFLRLLEEGFKVRATSHREAIVLTGD